MSERKLITQKRLAELVAHFNANCLPSTNLICDDVRLIVEAEYIRSSGPHRAWKYLYFLEIDGKKSGGYDRKDSFVKWATEKINEHVYRESTKFANVTQAPPDTEDFMEQARRTR